MDLTGAFSASFTVGGDARVLGAMTAVPLPTPPRRPILTYMTGVAVLRSGRLPISLMVASPLALLLLAIAVGTAAGSSTGRLTSPAASPNPAVVGTPVVFGVTYTDATGAAPTSVAVRIDGTFVSMSGSGIDYAHGVLFSVSATPAVGTHEVYYLAVDARGDRIWLHAANLIVQPTPTPTPKPTPTPTLKPIPTPTPTHSSSPTDPPTGASPVGSAPSHRPSPPAVKSSPSPTGGAIAAGVGVDGQLGNPAGAGTSIDPMAGIRGADAFTGTLSAYRNAGGARSESASLGLPFGPYDDRNRTLNQLLTAMLPTIATAGAGGAAWASFAFFGRRRRDGDKIDEKLLAAAAATSYEVEAGSGLRAVDESLMPRWRRPSLQEVRRMDPLRATADATHLSFDSAGVTPLADCERRIIGYRLVRLLDSPDEFRSAEIGILDQGDEVQLLRRQGVYCLVLCPDGRQGWVHRMTLAEPVRPPEIDPLEPFGPEPMPQYMDDVVVAASEDGAGEPGAGGLLEAYMKARSEIA